jgi:hypothetical protein
LTATTIIPTSSPCTVQRPTIHTSFITDCFVFDDYHKKINQVNQLIIEKKFLEAIKQLVRYGNREFLKSFQLRSEIKELEEDNNNNNNKKTTTTDITSLAPPFQTIGLLESKWLEMIKELVEYGNKNILGNFKLYLAMEEKREGEETKEIITSILDIKKEEKEIRAQQVQNPSTHQNNNNHNNTSWFRPRDKNGRFISTSTSTSQL